MLLPVCTRLGKDGIVLLYFCNITHLCTENHTWPKQASFHSHQFVSIQGTIGLGCHFACDLLKKSVCFCSIFYCIVTTLFHVIDNEQEFSWISARNNILPFVTCHRECLEIANYFLYGRSLSNLCPNWHQHNHKWQGSYYFCLPLCTYIFVCKTDFKWQPQRTDMEKSSTLWKRG